MHRIEIYSITCYLDLDGSSMCFVFVQFTGGGLYNCEEGILKHLMTLCVAEAPRILHWIMVNTFTLSQEFELITVNL